MEEVIKGKCARCGRQCNNLIKGYGPVCFKKLFKVEKKKKRKVKIYITENIF